MPRAPPSSRTTLFTELAMGAFSRGTAATVAVLAGAMTRPMPAPTTPMARASTAYGVVTVIRERAPSPAAMTASPAATVFRGPKRAAVRSLVPAVAAIESANGSAPSPASNGLKPWTSWRYWV